MNITILPNLPYGDTVSITKEIIQVLAFYHVDIFLPDETRAYFQDEGGVRFGAYEQIVRACDVMIAVGGDGTITRYASDAAEHRKPILGINGGHLGFLTGLEKSEISALSSLISGEYTLDTRMMLDARVFDENGSELFAAYCVNDAVVGRAGHIRMVDVGVELDGKRLSAHRADGVIVATPTGSTAYSMSAGGPVVDSHIECMVITPICSHSLTARSIVCSSESTVVMRNLSEKNNPRPMCLTADSREPVEVPYGGCVEIKKSQKAVDFITIKKQSFYEILQEKMIERNNG